MTPLPESLRSEIHSLSSRPFLIRADGANKCQCPGSLTPKAVASRVPNLQIDPLLEAHTVEYQKRMKTPLPADRCLTLSSQLSKAYSTFPESDNKQMCSQVFTFASLSFAPRA